jgi:hypothetical protein
MSGLAAMPKIMPTVMSNEIIPSIIGSITNNVKWRKDKRFVPISAMANAA